MSNTDPRMISTYGLIQCKDCLSRFDCNILIYFKDNVRSVDMEDVKKKRFAFVYLNPGKHLTCEERNRECVKGHVIENGNLPSKVKMRVLEWLGYDYQTGEIHTNENSD